MASAVRDGVLLKHEGYEWRWDGNSPFERKCSEAHSLNWASFQAYLRARARLHRQRRRRFSGAKEDRGTMVAEVLVIGAVQAWLEPSRKSRRYLREPLRLWWKPTAKEQRWKQRPVEVRITARNCWVYSEHSQQDLLMSLESSGWRWLSKSLQRNRGVLRNGFMEEKRWLSLAQHLCVLLSTYPANADWDQHGTIQDRQKHSTVQN